MSEMTFTKIAGATLAAGLLVMGLREISAGMFEPHAIEKPGWAPVVAEAPGGDTTEAVAGPVDFGTLFAAVDLTKGEDIFKKKCTSCHNAENGGANAAGPNLYGVVGKPAGVHAGFTYSEAMKAHGPWDFEAMYKFLENPRGAVKGTAMSFAGLKKQDERIAVIAYLNSKSGAPVPYPAPLPPAPEAAPATEAPADPAAAPAAGAAAPASPT